MRGRKGHTGIESARRVSRARGCSPDDVCDAVGIILQEQIFQCVRQGAGAGVEGLDLANQRLDLGQRVDLTGGEQPFSHFRGKSHVAEICRQRLDACANFRGWLALNHDLEMPDHALANRLKEEGLADEIVESCIEYVGLRAAATTGRSAPSPWSRRLQPVPAAV